jgi:P pilus assembly chaperone PapD
MTTGETCRRGRGRAHASAAVLVLFGALVLAPSTARAQVAVDELEMHFQLAPGRGELMQVIPVRNDQETVQQVRVVLNDWQRDTTGRNDFLPLGTHPGTCGQKVKVFPMTFQIAPGAVEYVRVTYDAGGALAGCWSIVLFESVKPPPPRDQQQGSRVNIEVRTGVKVYVHAANEVKSGEIAFADVVQAWVPKPLPPDAPRGARRDSTQVWQADLRFRNTGTAHLRLRATVEIRDLDGLLLQKVVSPEAYLTPDALRDLRITLPTLAKGDYLALVMVDYGGDEITAAQVEFTVP